jgi:hypothetical protein
MTVAGEAIYIATSPKDISSIWSNTKTISLSPIAEAMHVSAGLTKEEAKSIFTVQPGASYNAGKQSDIIPNANFIRLHHQQLLPGPMFEELMNAKILPSMTQHLRFANHPHPAVVRKEGNAVVVSLNDLVVNTFITSKIDAYFGPMLLQMSPDLPKLFTRWEHVAWKLLFNMPDFLSHDTVAVKEEIFGALAHYLKLPRDERPGAAYYITAFEDMLQEHGFKEDVIAKCLFFHFWAVNGNVYKLAFWLIAHLSKDEELMLQIRDEVRPAVQGDDIDSLILLLWVGKPYRRAARSWYVLNTLLRDYN